MMLKKNKSALLLHGCEAIMTGFSGSKRRSSESCIRWGRFPSDPAELLQKQKSLKL